MYNTYSFTVLVPGMGTVSVLANSRWHAIDIAYTTHGSQYKDRTKYKAWPTK